MKALVYKKRENFSITEVEKPVISDNQILLKVKYCGICKTDLHIHNGRFISEFPLIPGHEFTGIVEEVGKKVVDLKVGDRVVADNTVLCGKCYYCKRNQPLYCENFVSLGVTTSGGFAQYVAVNSDKIFTISDSLSFEDASFAEPTACAVHGMDMIDVQNGDNILMFGAGSTGIILAQLLKQGGAGKVVVAAPTQFKLDILKEYGIETVKINRSDVSVSEAEIKSYGPPMGYDIVIDATGATSILQSAFKYAKKGSKIVIYGVCNESDTISINPYDVFSQEYKIIGSFAQTHCFDRAINALETGIVKVDNLVTHKFSLDDYDKGLDTIKDGRQSIKILIAP